MRKKELESAYREKMMAFSVTGKTSVCVGKREESRERQRE